MRKDVPASGMRQLAGTLRFRRYAIAMYQWADATSLAMLKVAVSLRRDVPSAGPRHQMTRVPGGAHHRLRTVHPALVCDMYSKRLITAERDGHIRQSLDHTAEHAKLREY